jgi:hypothetical protein
VSAIIIGFYELDPLRIAEYPVIVEYVSAGWGVLYFLVALLITMGISYLNKYIKSEYLKL